MLWHWSRHTLPVSVRGAGLFFCCGFCCCGSVVFRVAFFSELALYGRILLHFRTPKEGYSACICVIRSTSTTRCDDLAEATGAQDGKKKPSNYSLLRLWHMQGSLQQTENDLRLQTGRSHMFTSWTVHYQLFAERVLLRKPPIFEAASVLQNHIRNGNFPQRRLRQRPPAEAVEAHQVALNQMRQNAEARQRLTG